MTTPIELRLTRMEAMLRVLVSTERPTMKLSEVKTALGYKSSNAARKWLLDHKVPQIRKGCYDRIVFINEATRSAA